MTIQVPLWERVKGLLANPPAWHIEPLNKCLRINLELLVNNGYAPDYVPLAICDSVEDAHNFIASYRDKMS